MLSKALAGRHLFHDGRPQKVCQPLLYVSKTDFCRHFDDAQFSDLVVRCRDDEYHVHRIIMCSHSQWFAKVCAKAATVRSHQHPLRHRPFEGMQLPRR